VTKEEKLREPERIDRLLTLIGEVRELLAKSPPITQLLARKDVLRRYGISRSTLYRLLAKGFPKPVRGFWRPADLDQWDLEAGQGKTSQTGQN
jgi:predicted DNA-binding transcriptional regulator AlpA